MERTVKRTTMTLNPQLLIDRIKPRLLSASRHRDILDDLIHTTVAADIELCWYADLSDMDSSGHMLFAPITKDIASNLELDIPKLMALGTANSSDDYQIESIDDLASDMDLHAYDDARSNLYALSCKQHMFGAAAVLNHQIQAKVETMFPEGSWIIPSSVHEMLVIPQNLDHNLEDVLMMVRTLNADPTVVHPDDVLSDHIFAYTNEGGIRAVI